METGFRSQLKVFRGTRGKVILAAIVLLLCLTVFFACGRNKSNLLKKAEVSEEFKAEYFIGEEFTPSGNLILYENDEPVNFVPITAEMVSGFDTSSAGEIVLTIRYEGYKATASVRVSALTATSIEIDAGTLPSVVYEKAPFPTTVTFTAKMSDGTVREHVPVAAYMIGGFNSSSIGEQTLSLNYLGAEALFRLTIKKDVRTSIVLVGACTEYEVGASLSLSGARLDVHYESGKVSTATLTENLVSDFHTELGGNFVAKVTYYGLECDYPYYVRKSPVSLSLIASTLPTIYEKGDAFPTGGKATMVYNDGTRENAALTAENVPAFDTTTAGEKRVEVIVRGVTALYEYEVLRSVTSATPFGYTAAVLQGSRFDGLGEFLIEYEDGGREDIAFTDTDRLPIRYNTAQVGDIVQKIIYRGREYTFTVHVYSESERDEVDHLEVAGVFGAIKQGDPLETEGIRVYIVYKYLTPELVPLQSEWVRVELPEDPIEEDYVDVPVTIECFGATYEELSVRVLSAEYAARVTAMVPYGFRSLYRVGETLDLENATLAVIYGGGYAVFPTEPVLPAYVTDFDTETKGEKQMTVTFDDYVVTVPYRVIDDEEAETVTALAVPSFDPLLFVGDDLTALDLEGAIVVLTLGYGYAVEETPLTLEMLSGGPFEEAGSAEILLTCRGATTTLTVNVRSEEDKSLVTEISVPETIVTYVGTPPDLSLYMLDVTYGYGFSSKSIPLDSDGVSISSFSTASVGTVTVTVTYFGQSCSASVTFIAGDGENVLQSLDVASDAQREFSVGEAFGGVTLLARYQSGRYERITVTEQMAPAFSTETAGNYTITITYGGRGVLYSYTVREQSQQGQL